MFKKKRKIFVIKSVGDWGLGIGDWGLGIGPNPQSPIPNPKSPIFIKIKDKNFTINIVLNLINL